MLFNRIIILTFCFVFCFCALAYVPVLLLLQQHAKAEMKEKIGEGKDSNESLFILSDADLQKIIWIEETEFIYNGILYDLVSSIREESGAQKIIAIADGKEENILKELFDFGSHDCPIHKIVSQLFKLLTVCSYNYVSDPISITAILNIKKNPESLIWLPASFNDIHVPPPRQFC